MRLEAYRCSASEDTCTEIQDLATFLQLSTVGLLPVSI